MLESVNKKGLGSFTLPGLLKVNVINVPAKNKRVGIDPFTKRARARVRGQACERQDQDPRAEEAEGLRRLIRHWRQVRWRRSPELRGPNARVNTGHTGRH